MGAHASGLTGAVEDEDVPAPFGARRSEVEVELFGTGVESTHPDQSGTTIVRLSRPPSSREETQIAGKHAPCSKGTSMRLDRRVEARRDGETGLAPLAPWSRPALTPSA